MKKLVAILFLTLYMLSATEAHQLLKLPAVFKHYAEHQKENKHISFLKFLNMHYMHGSPKDKDYRKDMELPFKSADNCSASLSPTFINVVTQVFISKVIDIPVSTTNTHREDFIPSAYISNIWQPPKSC
ncbi:hypothetical protein [Mucilaginibacter xinganensis]|uniref:Uncharacterized protein n=1 Tax=Mucilaginibacter xinganensis TaxID=1234841 RepID=A0A223NZR6_9SPHI|nr:hypothetical protein [Mucilaginibacter xinganensis]ASU35326.1 hypothetical protein MuYL_3441 [Mucilaginibacter xinganensis]